MLCLKCARLRLSGHNPKACGSCLILSVEPRTALRRRIEAAVRKEVVLIEKAFERDFERLSRFPAGMGAA